MTNKTTISLELLGIKLAIKATQSPDEVEAVAGRLRAQLEEIQKATGTPDTLRVVLLAALDLTRHITELEQELKTLREEAKLRSLALVERLDEATEATGDGAEIVSPEGNSKPSVLV